MKEPPRKAKLLLEAFKAKEYPLVKDHEFMVTYTQDHQWILSPKLANGERKVVNKESLGRKP